MVVKKGRKKKITRQKVELSSPKLRQYLKYMEYILKSEEYLSSEMGKIKKAKKITERKIRKEKEILRLGNRIKKLRSVGKKK